MSAECLPGNLALDDILGVGEKLATTPLMSFLAQKEIKAFDATCFSVSQWAEIYFSENLRLPLVESDPEQSAWFRLWGPYHS